MFSGTNRRRDTVDLKVSTPRHMASQDYYAMPNSKPPHLVAPIPFANPVAADVYLVASKGSLLRSTLAPLQSHSPVYDITTDSFGNTARTKVWSFDREKGELKEIATIEWSTLWPTMVTMGDYRLPISELLVRERKIKTNGSRTFMSETDKFKWVPKSGMFANAPSTWQCMSATSRGAPNAIVSSPLAIYRPQSNPRNNSLQRSISRGFLRTVDKISPFPSPARSSFSSDTNRPVLQQQPQLPDEQGVLEIYPGVDQRPHFRDIVVLTAILIATHRDEWKRLPRFSDSNTSEAVLSRMVDIYRSIWRYPTLPTPP